MKLIDVKGRHRFDVGRDLLVTRVLADGLLELIHKHGSDTQKALAHVWLHKVAEYQDGFDQEVKDRGKTATELGQRVIPISDGGEQ